MKVICRIPSEEAGASGAQGNRMTEPFRHQEIVTMGGLGRLGIPSKVRRGLGIEEGDKLYLVVEDETITIRKVVEIPDRKVEDDK